jgi:Tfp pilus assembly protein FimT
MARLPTNWRRGITFVELLIVIMILMIFLVIGIPNSSPVVQYFNLRGAAWQVAGDLRLARQRAVTLQKRFRVCVDTCVIAVPAGTYSVERDDGTPSTPLWVSETGVPVRLAQGVTITWTAAVVTFTPNGQASGSTFSVSNLNGTYCVVVSSAGRVAVNRPPTGTCP